MAGLVSKELEDLLNPLPVFADPEDNDDEATRARVVERLTAGEEEEGEEEGEEGAARLSALRRRNATLLDDTDRRYEGKPVTREQLLKDLEGSEEEEEEDDSLDEDEEEDDSLDEDEEEERSSEVEEEADGEDEENITSPPGIDFHKLTEGMDDLGVSEDDLESDEDELSDDDDDEEEEEEEGGIQTFSQDKVDMEVEKGKAVRNQIRLWDQLLEGRIKIQKALVTANQLPQPDAMPAFKTRGGAEMAGTLKTAHKALKALQWTLLELHDHLLYQNGETRSIAGGVQNDDEDIDSDDGDIAESEAGPPKPPKRKLEMAEYPDVMAKRFAAFRPYCDATLQKWHDKTRLTTGKSGKGFAAFDRNIVTQVEQVLMDKERLLRRTQTRRSEYRVLGKTEAPVVAVDDPAEGETKANRHLKDLDEDVFDDDDFYHQLLRELIERRTSASDPNDQVAMGRQWLAIQKLRSKIKKKVDTKASKGRKVRFHVHAKLVNFMAPVDRSFMSDEARSELYRGLFGQNVVRE